MFAAALIVSVAIAFATAQMPSQCQNSCVQQNARNQQLYNQMFQGSISQNDYNTVCNDINTVQSCLQQCQGQSGSNQNQGGQQFGQNGSGGMMNNNNNNNNNGGFQSSSSSSSGQQMNNGGGSQGGNNQGSDCLSVSLPIYTSACNAGYQQFSQLGQCYQRLNSGYSQAKQQCQQQCASTSNKRRRRQSSMNNSLVNSNTFCLQVLLYFQNTNKFFFFRTNCGLSQQLSTIQSQCNSWVAQFAQTVSQTYNQLYQLSPSCLRM
uniref:Uncharacterized protein n=1 Tax=Panagrolaimus sp. PS1159 TaxID=55785 RepID=A0AC35EWR0_9BILA